MKNSIEATTEQGNIYRVFEWGGKFTLTVKYLSGDTKEIETYDTWESACNGVVSVIKEDSR